MRALVSIAGVDVPAPSVYNATCSTAVDSGRNVKGEYIGAVIREDMAKVELTWKFISAEDWAVLLQLFLSRYGGSFTNPVTFFNQTINGWETREMYVSDRTAGIYLRDKLGRIRGYTNARIALVEV